MTRKNRTPRKRGRRNDALEQIRGPPVNVFRYRGRVKTRDEAGDLDTRVTTISNFSTLSSTVGGVIANVFTSDPSLSTDFADLALDFTRFRVLTWEIEALPINQYSKTTTVCIPGVGVLDRNNATALASLNAAEGYPSAKRLSLENPWTMKLDMDDIDEGSYIQLGAPVAFSWIKTYFAGLTPSTDYMQVLQRWRLQLRDRR